MTDAPQSLSANESRQSAFLKKPSRMLLNCLKIGDHRARAIESGYGDLMGRRPTIYNLRGALRSGIWADGLTFASVSSELRVIHSISAN